MSLSVKADETALELFRRSNRKPLRTGLAFIDEMPGTGGSSKENGVGRGDVVELYGQSGTGKSEVLINVVVQHVLPKWLGGEEQTAYYFDNDGRLSILRLEQLLKEKINNNTTFQVRAKSAGGFGGVFSSGAAGSTQLGDDIEGLLTGCLSRLRVVRPSSLFELLASLEVLRFELQQRPAVVVVDGVASFYWQDKMAQSCGGDAVTMQGAVAKSLARLVSEQPVVLLAAKSALFASRGGSNNLEHREYLPQAWQRAVTHRVILQRRQKRPRTSPTRPRANTTTTDNNKNSTSTLPTLSLFTARVCSLREKGGGAGAGRSTVPRRDYFFVVTDDGIHDVPAAAAAAALGQGSDAGGGWRDDDR